MILCEESPQNALEDETSRFLDNLVKPGDENYVWDVTSANMFLSFVVVGGGASWVASL